MLLSLRLEMGIFKVELEIAFISFAFQHTNVRDWLDRRKGGVALKEGREGRKEE